MALGSAITVAGLFFFLRRGWRQLAVAEAYHTVARRLGLPADTRGLSLHGHLGEQRIWVGQVMVGHGPERTMVCWGVLDHERPLGLGLLLRRRGLSERLWRRARAPDVRLLDEELDRVLEAQGDEPHLVQALLDDEVRGQLLRILRKWRDLVVTDDAVRVSLRQPLASSEELQALVDDLRGLSAALTASRTAVAPPSALTDTVDQWTTLAERTTLTLLPAYPAAAGAVDGRRVGMWPVRTSTGFAADLTVVFRPHRSNGLQVLPQHGPDGYWSVGQDIQVGDPQFDSRFVIKGYDPEAVRELLGPDAREHLLALSAEGTLEVDDVRLRVSGVRLDPSTLEGLLQRALAAAAAMGW